MYLNFCSIDQWLSSWLACRLTVHMHSKIGMQFRTPLAIICWQFSFLLVLESNRFRLVLKSSLNSKSVLESHLLIGLQTISGAKNRKCWHRYLLSAGYTRSDGTLVIARRGYNRQMIYDGLWDRVPEFIILSLVFVIVWRKEKQNKRECVCMLPYMIHSIMFHTEIAPDTTWSVLLCFNNK